MVQTVDNQAGHIRGVVGVGVSIGEKEASELRLLRWAVLETAANAKAGPPKLAFLSRDFPTFADGGTETDARRRRYDCSRWGEKTTSV